MLNLKHLAVSSALFLASTLVIFLSCRLVNWLLLHCYSRQRDFLWYISFIRSDHARLLTFILTAGMLSFEMPWVQPCLQPLFLSVSLSSSSPSVLPCCVSLWRMCSSAAPGPRTSCRIQPEMRLSYLGLMAILSWGENLVLIRDRFKGLWRRCRRRRRRRETLTQSRISGFTFDPFP